MNNINQFETTERLKCSADTKLFFDDVYKSGTRTKEAQVETVQCGRSMIEMLGVLAIVGVLSVGGIAGYSKAMEKFKINKTIDQVSQIATNIRTLYAQQTTYDGLTETSAIQMGAIPDSLSTSLTPYTSITNAFGGNVYLSTLIWWEDGRDKFFIEYANLPKEACISLASMDWGNPTSSGLYAIGISGEYTTHVYQNLYDLDWEQESNGVIYSSKYLPFTVAKVSSLCNCNSNSCQILWAFK